MKRRPFFWLCVLLFAAGSLAFGHRPKTPPSPPPSFIPSEPWVAAINQIGFYAFHAELNSKGAGNRIVAPFETLQVLIEKESGENPSRETLLKSISDSMLASKEHAVDLKVTQEKNLRSLEFKGEWAEKFHSKKLKRLSFKTPHGERSVPMLRGTVYEAYLQEDHFQAVRLKYGDGKMALYIFLPKSADEFLVFVKDLNEAKLQNTFTQFLERHGEVKMPRLDLSYEADLQSVTRDLGLTFEQVENLKAVFRTDEKGAKETLAGPAEEIVGPEKFQMTVDRPFFFVVRDNETGLFLLLGTVTNPAEKN